MKEVLCDQNHADVSVMAAFRKQVTHLLGVDVVQQILEDLEARSAASVFKICRDALVKMYVPIRQFSPRGNRVLLAIATDHPAVEIPIRTRNVEFLQQPYAEGLLDRSARSTYYAREQMLKFNVTTHG